MTRMYTPTPTPTLHQHTHPNNRSRPPLLLLVRPRAGPCISILARCHRSGRSARHISARNQGTARSPDRQTITLVIATCPPPPPLSTLPTIHPSLRISALSSFYLLTLSFVTTLSHTPHTPSHTRTPLHTPMHPSTTPQQPHHNNTSTTTPLQQPALGLGGHHAAAEAGQARQEQLPHPARQAAVHGQHARRAALRCDGGRDWLLHFTVLVEGGSGSAVQPSADCAPA